MSPEYIFWDIDFGSMMSHDTPPPKLDSIFVYHEGAPVELDPTIKQSKSPSSLFLIGKHMISGEEIRLPVDYDLITNLVYLTEMEVLAWSSDQAV